MPGRTMRSLFSIPKMDCPSEERIVRMALDGGAHIASELDLSTNDVLANLGVIVAGALVAWTGSRAPDLVIGTVVGAVQTPANHSYPWSSQ